MSFRFEKSVIPLILITLVISVLAFFTLKDELELIQNSTIETVQISSCVVNKFDMGEQGVGSVNDQFATQAVLTSGQKVTGAFIHPTQSLCEKRLYRNVEIWVHSSDVNLSRQNTFFDFWLVPFLFGLVILVLVLQIGREMSTGRFFRNAVYAVLGVGLLVLLGNYGLGYETARDLESLGFDVDELEDVNRSESNE